MATDPSVLADAADAALDRSLSVESYTLPTGEAVKLPSARDVMQLRRELRDEAEAADGGLFRRVQFGEAR